MPVDVVYASTSLEPPRVLRALPRKRLAALAMAAVVAHGVPERFLVHGAITIDGEVIPRAQWEDRTPPEGARVEMLLTHAGGDSGGVKNVLSIVASIALTLATAGIATAGLAIGGTTILAAGSTAARIVAGAVGLIGQLAIQALFAPPQAAKERETVQATRSSIAGNTLQRGQTIPRVAGTMRVAPPLSAQPRTYLDGDDSYAEAVFVLAGPHQLSAIQIAGVGVEDLDDVDVWTDDGTAGTRTNQFAAYAVTQQVGAQLTLHATRSAESGKDDRDLVDQDDPDSSLPSWQRVTARAGCDYADMLFTIGNMYDASAGDVDQVLWLRFRARKEGESTWKNIGTVGYVGRGQSSFNRRVRFRFATYTSGETEEARDRHGFRAVSTLPVVTVDHVNFKTTDSDHFPAAYTHNWFRKREGIDCWLNDAYYLDSTARYEFEVMRSEMVEASGLSNIATMQRSDSAQVDYFDARGGDGNWAVQEEVTDQGDVVVLQAMASVYEEVPIPSSTPVATIQVRVKNKDIPQLSVLATGLVPDLVAGVWSGNVATDNPAAHYRYALVGAMTANPIDAAYLDADRLADWHAECETAGYSCGLLLDGSLEDALAGIAACGYAKPTTGLKYGVVYWRDTSGDTAVQAFTPRNIRDLEWSVAYSKRPAGFNVSFLNAALNFEQDEIYVEDPYPIPGDDEAEIEAVTYPGLTTAAAVTARAEFDFLQARNATRWSFLTSIEHLVTAEGDIAILSHDQLDAQAGYARISEVLSSTTFSVDATIDWEAGWGVAVRTPDNGVVELAISAWDAETRTATVADTSDLTAGDLCVFGPTSTVSRRVQVLRIEPESLHLARITCQPELLVPEE